MGMPPVDFFREDDRSEFEFALGLQLLSFEKSNKQVLLLVDSVIRSLWKDGLSVAFGMYGIH